MSTSSRGEGEQEPTVKEEQAVGWEDREVERDVERGFDRGVEREVEREVFLAIRGRERTGLARKSKKL